MIACSRNHCKLTLLENAVVESMNLDSTIAHYVLELVDDFKIQCVCGCTTTIYGLNYQKKIIHQTTGEPSVLLAFRVRCTSSKSSDHVQTHVVIPENYIPYRQESMEFVCELVVDAHTHTHEELSEIHGMDVKTVQRWIATATRGVAFATQLFGRTQAIHEFLSSGYIARIFNVVISRYSPYKTGCCSFISCTVFRPPPNCGVECLSSL